MYMRLAFAVAAHLEPDILIVDEVLAVGDAEFQKKCLGTLENLSVNNNRTVILVTHDLETLQYLCKKAIFIDEGTVQYVGNTNEAIDRYLRKAEVTMKNNDHIRLANNSEYVSIHKVEIADSHNKISNQVACDSLVRITIGFTVLEHISAGLVSLIFRKENRILYVSSDQDVVGSLREYEPGMYETTVLIPPHLFNPSLYNLEVNIQKPDAVGATRFANMVNIPLRITGQGYRKTALYGGRVYGFLGLNIEMTTKLKQI